MANTFRTDCEGFHRRDFLRFGTAGLFGLTLPQLLKLEAQAKKDGSDAKRKADAVITSRDPVSASRRKNGLSR